MILYIAIWFIRKIIFNGLNNHLRPAICRQKTLYIIRFYPIVTVYKNNPITMRFFYSTISGFAYSFIFLMYYYKSVICYSICIYYSCTIVCATIINDNTFNIFVCLMKNAIQTFS